MFACPRAQAPLGPSLAVAPKLFFLRDSPGGTSRSLTFSVRIPTPTNLPRPPCLLLQTIGSKTGPSGRKGMSQTTFIQRLNTNGGSAPATGCSASTDVGKQALVPYTADYYFYAPQRW